MSYCRSNKVTLLLKPFKGSQLTQRQSQSLLWPRRSLLICSQAARQLWPHLLPPPPSFPLSSTLKFLEDLGHNPTTDLCFCGSFPRSPRGSLSYVLQVFLSPQLLNEIFLHSLFKISIPPQLRNILLPARLYFFSIALIVVSHTLCLVIYIYYWYEVEY